MKKHIVYLILFLVIMSIMFSCQENKSSDQRKEVSLKELFKNDFLMGATLNPMSLRDTAVIQLVKHHFNVTTAENEMKMHKLQPKEGEYNFGPADSLIVFAQANNMKVIGHTLCWHAGVPKWFFLDEKGDTASKEILHKRIKDHIFTVMEHFKGKVIGWDVVNEAIEDPWTNDSLYRFSELSRTCGNEFIEKAFFWAHEADPDVELYYNDYALDNPKKREKAIHLIKDLRSKGLRVDGIGMQAHYKVPTLKLEEVEKSIIAFSELGLKVMITELDLSLYHHKEKGNLYAGGAPDSMLQKQAEVYAGLFKIYHKHRDKITRVNFWGTTDRYSWLNNHPVRGRADHALLFDRKAVAKPAFRAVVKTADEK
jgi:endo-1,4-beta-xylanase